MAVYSTPGLYLERLNTAPPVLMAQRTDIVGFVGFAERGLLHTPQRIESWSQFTAIFGSYVAQGYLVYAVHAFFANGGRTCWVVRVADPEKASCGSIELLDEAGDPALRLTACTPGAWAQKLQITVLSAGDERFTLTLRLPDGTREMWRDVRLKSAEAVLNDKASGSRLVCAKRVESSARTLRPQHSSLKPGTDGLKTVKPMHFSGNGAQPDKLWGLATLALINEISILAAPDIMTKPPPAVETLPVPAPDCEILDNETNDVQAMKVDVPADEPPEQGYFQGFDGASIRELQWQMILQCETLRNRIVILDMPSKDTLPTSALETFRDIDSRYAALYYPWLSVADPQGQPGDVVDVPPCGHIAGVYARVDGQFGAHKPPANELLADAVDVTVPLDDVLHGVLNEQAVNVLRAYPGRGLRVAGARLLTRDSLWKYVNVRRLIMMISRSIDVGTQWIVFEPNNPEMWRDTTRVVTSFLDGLWRRGMLDGETADHAYTVRCDATVNPPSETDLGRLTCLVSVRAPWPAEVVVVRIGRTEGGSLLLEG